MKNLLLFAILLFVISCTPKLQNNTHRVTSQDDILKIEYKGEADSVRFEMFQGPGVDLTRNQLDIFEGELEIPDLDNGIFSYGFSVKKDSAGTMLPIDYKPKEPKSAHFQWIGSNRTDGYTRAMELKQGTLSIDTCKTKEFERTMVTYTPFNLTTTTPIIYMTDGQNIKKYAQYIDQLITEKRIKPIKIVGMYCSRGMNRFYEYVYISDTNELFLTHKDIVLNKLLPNVEREIPNWKGKKYAYGVSNGAAYCVYLGLNYPNLFEEIIALSTVGYINEYPNPIEFNQMSYPKFYMGAGRYEDWAFDSNIKFIKKMSAQNIDLEFKEYISGHDYNVWRVEFLDYIVKRFGTS